MKQSHYNRRRFLAYTSALTAASLLGFSRMAAAEPPPEIDHIRILHTPATCLAPQAHAEDLLRLEGFSEVEYVMSPNAVGIEATALGAADVLMWDAPGTLPVLDAGLPLVVLAGIHLGCYELFATGSIRRISDLKGRSVAVYWEDSGAQALVRSMLAYVGLDPRKDVRWVMGPKAEDAKRLFVEGKADAFIGFPPHPQELRAEKFGHVILNTTEDRPWSQYFCCMLCANADFVQRNPIASKRALRAYLRAADICAQDPQRVARYIVAKGYEPRYEFALDILTRLPWSAWRHTNPEDTLRFHALRLYEVGMIKTNPNRLIERGTDWRILKELKREMKA